MKKAIKNYLTFSKKERVAICIILVVGGGFVALPYFYGNKKKPQPVNAELKEQVASIQTNKPKKYAPADGDNDNGNWQQPEEPARKAELFQFDPNTLDEAGWIRLGIREKTARTIINYRSKGGKFRTAEDIRKIWGLRKEDADRLIPYIVIAKAGDNNTYTKNAPPTSNKPSLLDANTATPQELRNIPGIGSSLPYKIVNYREKLGGFLNMLQVKETMGMTDSIFTAILPHLHVLPTEIKKINLNAASDYELDAHPYIDKHVAKAITIYRTQHGGFKTVDEVKKIVFINQVLYEKIAPYLEVK